MNTLGRPPLHAITCEQIDQLLHRVDQQHWPNIVAFRAKRRYPLDEPIPPLTPEHLMSAIRWYASMLYKSEADQYEQFRSDSQYPVWLSRLSDRMIGRVMKALDQLDGADPDALLLSYHGLRKDQIETELKKFLWDIGKQYELGTAPGQRGTGAPETIAPIQMGLSRADTPAQGTLGNQIESLIAECEFTKEHVAELLGVDVRQVYRHCAGQTVPRRSHIAIYQNLFSKKLGKTIILSTSVKRHDKS